MKNTEPPVIIEHSFNASSEKVWEAITEHDQMLQWFFENIPDFKAEVDFETAFPVQVEDRTFTHLWKITEVIKHKRIIYRWKYKEYPGDAILSFELFDQKAHVKLRLVMHVIESFPDHIPEFSRDSCIGGWNYFIGKRLKEYLE